MLVGGGPCEFLPWAPTVCRLTTGFTALLKLNYFSSMPENSFMVPPFLLCCQPFTDRNAQHCTPNFLTITNTPSGYLKSTCVEVLMHSKG